MSCGTYRTSLGSMSVDQRNEMRRVTKLQGPRRELNTMRLACKRISMESGLWNTSSSATLYRCLHVVLTSFATVVSTMSSGHPNAMSFKVMGFFRKSPRSYWRCIIILGTACVVTITILFSPYSPRHLAVVLSRLHRVWNRMLLGSCKASQRVLGAQEMRML